MKLLLGLLTFACCSLTAVATPEALQACFRNALQPAGATSSRVKRDVAVAEMKRLFPDTDKELVYLRRFKSGLKDFHIAKDLKNNEECAIEIENTANSMILKLMFPVFTALAGVKGIPVLKHSLELRDRKYNFYAHSLPGPNFLSLLVSGYVSLQQAQRWLYQLANAVLELQKKGYGYNQDFLSSVYLDHKSTNQLLLLPSELPSNKLLPKNKLEDFKHLFKFIRYVLGVFFQTETKGRFPDGITGMKREQDAAFDKGSDRDKLKAFKEGTLDFLTKKEGGWFVNWNAADVSELTSWKAGNTVEEAITAPTGYPCLVQAYNAAGPK